MNTYHAKNNIYKNGEWKIDRSKTMAWKKAISVEPTTKQVAYRDDLYKFCLQRGLVREGFRIGRTKNMIHANISALISILEKNGLADEFFGAREKDDG